jgi:polysaccharide biosynthesis transport protein
MSATAADRRESEGIVNTLSVLRRRWPLIVGVVIACMAIAVVRHERSAKSYAATASVAFRNGTLPDAALQVTQSGSGEPVRDAATEVLIAHSAEVAQRVRKQLAIPVETTALLKQVSVEAAPNADILNFIASTGSPTYSARLANAFAGQYIAFKAAAQLVSIEAAQRQLEQQIAALPAGSAERTTLQQSAQRLAELRAVAGGGASIIGFATPPSKPSGMSVATTAAVGLLIGLAVALSIVFLLESLDRRIKTIEAFEREYRLPALTGVPQSAFAAKSAEERMEALEPYRILRSALDFVAVTHKLDALLITSAVSAEGKTTVAIDLAHAVALTGRRVVLAEFDLRRPSFTQHFDLNGRDGLTTALARGESVVRLLVQPFEDVPTLLVLASGRLPPNPSELLGSAAVDEVVRELAGEEGLLIIDAPPLNPVADAQVLLNNPAIDATIIVARADRTTREEVRRARAILDRHVVEPIGLVVTGLRDAGRYGYEAYDAVAPTNNGGSARSLSRPAGVSAQRPAD